MGPLLTHKATRLNLLDFKTVPIRTFWITSIAFFICFFAWFGIVPFMPDVVKDLGLTPSQKMERHSSGCCGNSIRQITNW